MDWLNPHRISEILSEHLIPFGLSLVAAIATFIIGRWIAKLLIKALTHACEKAELDTSLTKFIADLSYAVLLLVVVIASLERLGVQTTSAIAVLGAAGLAVGLALQGSLSDFASGVMIIVFRPYSVGDVIGVAGHVGQVQAIKMFNTILHTGDNRRIIIPNGTITGGTIENLNLLSTRRVDLVFGIGYDDDLQQAKQLLSEILKSDPRVLKDPEPFIAVGELAESSVNIMVRPWTKTEDWWAVRCETTEKVKQVFDENHISIPFPQHDIHLFNAPQPRSPD